MAKGTTSKASSHYGRRKYMPKKGAKKSTYKPKSLTSSEKAETCYLMAQSFGNTKAAFNVNGAGRLALSTTDSVCAENIPIAITNAFADNWTHKVLNKYEEYRIQEVKVQILFKNHDNVCYFLIDRDSTPPARSKDIMNDPNGSHKLIRDNNNYLNIT